MKCASLIGLKKIAAHIGTTSFVAVAAAFMFFALEVSAGVVDAGDLDAESIDAPADAPPPPARRLTLATDS